MMEDFEDEGTENKSSEFAKMLEDSFKNTKRNLSSGDKITAEVLSIGKDEVYVSTGTMYDGLVPRRDLLDSEGTITCKVGDHLTLYVTSVRGSEIYLSPKPTAKNVADDLEDAFDMELPVEGKVTEVCKGGFRVSIHGKSAFCPISQMDAQRIENPEEYVGRRLEFRITQFSEGGRNVVVSRRKLLDEQRSLSEGAFLDENHVGTVMRGQVTRMEKFGAFVRLDSGLEGLLHISELSWSRVNDPSEVLRVGQEVFVKVLKAEDKEGHLKISLSLKQAQAEPWSQLPTHIQAGSVVSGKVTRCMKFGAFVELIPGVEGLIPLSEMSYTKRVVRSDELVHEGETVSVMIKELNSSDRKILLSLKDAGADPWALVPQKFPVGAIIKGQVERREPYGLFVKLDDGVVALLSKSKALEESSFNFEKVKLGEEIFVQVAELNLDQRRISLSVPRDPEAGEWKSYTQTSTGSFGTLGDQFSKLLSQKKKS